MELFQKLSYKTSKLTTRTYSTSFSLAVSFLEPEIRQAIYNIYGFVRFADEIVDTFHTANKKQLLHNFERDYFDAFEHGISLNPILYSFVLTVKKYNISQQLIEAFLKSMEADLYKNEYNSETELNEYIYGSANVVGLMCLQVFVNGNTTEFNKLQKPAMKLGSAFQKVNFIRDLKDDIEQLNRKYFPQLEVEKFNDNIKLEIIKNIELDFKEAKEGISKLPGKSKLAVYIAYVYYLQLLKKIKNKPAKLILDKRIRINNFNKMLLLTGSIIKYSFKVI